MAIAPGRSSHSWLYGSRSFSFFEVVSTIDSPGVTIALAVGAGLVLLLNTASIMALMKHYAEDKQHLYGLDIHYLDEMKRLKR